MAAPAFPAALAEALYEQLLPLLPGLDVELLERVDSTNTRLLERARQGLSSPCLMAAAEQTAGRGRMGRSWLGARGDALTFSLGLPMAPQYGFGGLSLAVGVALAQALHPHVTIKWPNDLQLSGAKLCGVLIETANLPGQVQGVERYVVAGVGLNLSAPKGSVGQAAAGLRELEPLLSTEGVLATLALPLVRALKRFEAQGFAAFSSGFAERDALLGRAVRLSDGQEGVAHGANAEGALLVHTDTGAVVAVQSGEVSVRLSARSDPPLGPAADPKKGR